jgi:uncharacterized protein YjiS (DUF1127 family)
VALGAGRCAEASEKQSIQTFSIKTQLLELCTFCIAAAQHYYFSARQISLCSPQQIPPAKAGLREKRKAMFAAIVRFIREWKKYNRSLIELSRLGDRELADIGISRSDIHRVAWNAAQRR